MVQQDAVIITAKNDSLAYEQAYDKWLGSCYAYNHVADDLSKLGMDTHLDKPISFALLNKDGEDVAKSLNPRTITNIEQRLDEREKRLRQKDAETETIHGSSSGQTDYYISKDGFGAKSKKALSDLVRYLSHNDISSARQMLARGELVPLEVGMGVYLLDYGVAQCRVEISDGPYKGSIVYVITEYVAKR